MPLTPSHHISQLRPVNGILQGANDCFEAAVTRYLRASSFPWPGDDLSLVEHVRLRATGKPDTPTQPYTKLEQVVVYFAAAGIPYRVDTDPAGITQPWTLALVRGVRLTPAQYPFDWLGADAPDHFILMLPGLMVNDPLAYFNAQQDCAYTTDSLRSAMQGSLCYHLADPATIEWDTNRVAHRIPTPVPPAGLVMKVAQHLRAIPKVLPAVGPLVAAGTPLVPAPGIAPWGSETTSWRRVQTKDGIVGWVLKANLGAA